jgi:carboxyl-terminal processing protease
MIQFEVSEHASRIQHKLKIPNSAKSVLLGISLGILLATSFIAGFVVKSALSSVGAEAIEQYSILQEVQSLLNTFYLRDQPEPLVREYAAIRGMLNSLEDRYTFFIEPQVAQSEADALAGTYGGVGLLVHPDQSGHYVLFPYENSPAIGAGIANGDFLISINGDPVEQLLPIDNVNQLLRGEVVEGNGVEVTYQARESGQVNSVFLSFAVIEVPSVIWRLVENYSDVGYIKITLFTNRTPDELANAFSDLNNQGIRYIVLDLRDNSGGLLQEAIEVASYFLRDVPIAYERTSNEERALMAMSSSPMIDLPLVVLVNSGSASAAELVAAALQDHRRAVLVGQVTYGKGSVQQVFRLSDGSSAHITTAEWLTPLRHQIAEIGITPDFEVSDEDNNSADEYINAAISILMREESE